MESSTPTSPAGPARLSLLDALRGVAIITVVVGHVAAGINTATATPAPWLGDLTQLAYSVHMPLFAFMAGLFVARSCEKRGQRAYLWSRVVLIVYLYLLWTLLQGTAEVVTSGLRNGQTNLTDLVALWSPIAHLWFLPWLLIATTIAVVVRPWRPTPGRWLLLAASAAVMVAMWGVNGTYVWNRGLSLLFLFFLGATLTDRSIAALQRYRRLRLGILGAVAIVAWFAIVRNLAITVPTTPAEVRTPGSVALGVLAAGLGMIGSILLAAALAPRRSTATLIERVGLDSMAIYLGHILVAAGTRIVLMRIGVENELVLLVAAVLLGTAIPMLIARIPVVGDVLFSSPQQWARRRPPGAVTESGPQPTTSTR